MEGLVYDRWLMRRLPTTLRAGGFELLRSRSYGNTALPEPTYMFTLVDRGADLLLDGGRRQVRLTPKCVVRNSSRALASLPTWGRNGTLPCSGWWTSVSLSRVTFTLRDLLGYRGM